MAGKGSKEIKLNRQTGGGGADCSVVASRLAVPEYEV